MTNVGVPTNIRRKKHYAKKNHFALLRKDDLYRFILCVREDLGKVVDTFMNNLNRKIAEGCSFQAS